MIICQAYANSQKFILALIIASFVSGCSDPEELNVAEPASARSMVAPASLTSAQLGAIDDINADVSRALDTNKAQDLAKKALERALFDPASATYRSIRLGRNGSVCGMLNAKNRYGAYVGFKNFVVSGEGGVWLSTYNDGIETDTNSEFSLNYLTYCATKSESAHFAARTAPVPAPSQPDYSQEPDSVLDASDNDTKPDASTS